MSDIKHQFTGGKMNKDLDERLIPNGEYRDAMNIQVSTSEGSKVGTVQNIQGNDQGCATDITPAGSVTIGSIADEKNDSLYWLVSGPSFDGTSLKDFIGTTGFISETDDGSPYYAKDMIMRKTVYGCEPVLVDQWAGIFPNINPDGGWWADTIGNNITLSNEDFLDHIHLGMKVHGINPDGKMSKIRTVSSLRNQSSITSPYSQPPLLGTTITLTPTSSPPVAHFVAKDGKGGKTIVLNVIFIENYDDGMVEGAIVPGDLITSGIDYFGVLAMNNARITASLGNGLFRIDTQLATTNATAGAGTNDEEVGTNGVTYYPYFLGIIGSMGQVEVIRNIVSSSNELVLPAESQWLNEISAVFWNVITHNKIVAIDDPEVIKVSPNSSWPQGGCIDPDSVDKPAKVFFTRGMGHHVFTYDRKFRVVDCETGEDIVATKAPYAKSGITLQIEGDGFSNETIYLDEALDLQDYDGGYYDYLYFWGERTLNFSPTKKITGINIIDDMLFWVDGKEDEIGTNKVIGTEPKKINIKKSVAGTHPNGNHHTKLVNDDSAVLYDASVNGPPVKEEHITVIKKAPSAPLHFDIITDRVLGENYSGIMKVCASASEVVENISSFTSSSSNTRDFNGLKEGDIFRTIIETDLSGSIEFSLPSWKVGTVVVLKEFDEDGTRPEVPFAGNEYRIKGVIVAWDSWSRNSTAENGARVAIRITSIAGSPPQAPSESPSTLNYVIDTYFDSQKLFEYKFPRFSYRYKYRDGELSTYAPFTSVVFSPGSFNYHPTKGYNLGMTNILQEVHLKGFVTNDIPADVVAIELLYKDDASPNVYIIDTIKENDQAEPSEEFNNWDNNAYKIKHESIHSTVPSNQLLRAWDNVPRKALAQEVTGNRIVYGNYLQNYDLNVGNEDFYPTFVTFLSKTKQAYTTKSPTRSIKSLRDYQLGVVFTDKYGRETPVIANDSGAFKVPKSDAKFSNAISVGLDGNGPPVGLEYFKFFIKETSGEYYNLAMDRFFKAEDGNYWLSFPSIERNKIDEDTFLILKKGHDSREMVSDKARYKVLAIENGAPDFIKTFQYNIGEVKQIRTIDDGDTDDSLFAGLVDAPAETKNSFKLIGTPLANSTLSSLHEMNDDLYVEFGFHTSDQISKRYRITKATHSGTNYHITIDGTFGNDVDFISNNQEVIHGTIVRFYKYEVENKSIFDGRFFVKILNDEVFKKNVDQEDVSEKEYIVSAEKKVYFMSRRHLQRHATESEVDNDSYSHDFGTNSAIKDYHESTGAQRLSNFPNADDDNVWDGVNGGSAQYSNNWFKYETYFKNKYYDNANGSNGSLHTRHRGEGLENGTASSKIFEDVMFIDRGHYVGNQNQQNSDHLMTGALNDYDNYNGRGIQNLSSKGYMDLSFGSLEPESVTGKQVGGSGGSYYTNSWGTGDINNATNSFWDLLHTDRSKYNHLAPIYNKIQSGQQFRWKEDPTQTIYTIVQQVENRNINRFDNTTKGAHRLNHNTAYYKSRKGNGHIDDKIHVVPGDNSDDYWVGGGSPYTLASNFQKKKTFIFTPSMYNWDPTQDDTLGSITGGAEVDSYLRDWEALSGGGSGYYGGELDDDFDDADTLEVPIEELLEGGRKDSYPDNSLTIPLDQYRNLYDTENKKRHITLVGMILTDVGSDELDPPVLVSEITVDTDSVTIYFKGYQGTSGEFEIQNYSGALENIVFKQPSMNGLSVNSANNINDANADTNGIGAIGYTMQFVEEKEPENIIPSNPAIWETEPKESTDLDIYYEISGNNPITLNSSTIKTALPVQSTVYCIDGGGTENLEIITNNDFNGITIRLNEALCAEVGGCILENESTISEVAKGTIFRVERPDGTNIEVEVDEVLSVDSGYLQGDEDGEYDVSRVFKLKTELYNVNYTLDWHNCYSFGNGVESNRIRDTFNLPFITNGVKASSTLEGGYKEEHRKYGLIYSGVYNSNSSVNNLNQFIAAEKITKDINPIYGGIQKLHSRSTADGDLIVLCEDRVLKILASKDALYNADGNPQLIANNMVLGQAIPFSGDYGISKNPESFASESYRVYFADKVRGKVMRLSKDGLTAISDHGMKDWFRDNLKLSTKIIGSHDDRNDEYNITLDSTVAQSSVGETVSFKEDVRGWVSFKSFTPENAISCANEYYTFNNGTLWKHHVKKTTYGGIENNRNTFYKEYGAENEGFTPSSINVIINDSPSIIKTFHTLNYEGTQSKVEALTHYTGSNGTSIPEDQYYNLEAKKGWNVQSITTDQEKGSVKEFIEKEGKWFNYIRGKAGSTTSPTGASITSGFNNADFAFQGLGRITQAAVVSNAVGCTANGNEENYSGNVNDLFDDGQTAFNYDSLATIDDDGSCIQVSYGCTDDTGATTSYTGTGVDANGDPLNFVNTDDGSCAYYGCIDNSMFNFDPFANTTDGTCIPFIYGCMDDTEIDGDLQYNYNSAANTENVDSCVQWIYGCMIEWADNYNSNATLDNGSCVYVEGGCTYSNACNYTANTAGTTYVDVGFCEYCGDTAAVNYDNLPTPGDSCPDSSKCLYCNKIEDTFISTGENTSPDTQVHFFWTETGLWNDNQNATVDHYKIFVHNVTQGIDLDPIYYYNVGTGNLTRATMITGLNPGTTYQIGVQAVCVPGGNISDGNAYNDANPVVYTEVSDLLEVVTAATVIQGCTDATADNYDATATLDLGTCVYEGCTDPNSLDGATQFTHPDGPPYYSNPINATIDDGSCIPFAYGCTDSSAFNHDPLANTDDGSCIPFVLGCLDASVNNAGTNYAAVNYSGPDISSFAGTNDDYSGPPNVPANTDDGTCKYIMPSLWDQVPSNGGGTPKLNEAGWWASGVWTSLIKLRAYWDVSLSPKIDFNNLEIAYEQSYSTSNDSGDITNFVSPGVKKFSTNDGMSWGTSQSPVQLMRMDVTGSTNVVPFVNNEAEYPPYTDDGAQKQVGRFTFVNELSGSYYTSRDEWMYDQDYGNGFDPNAIAIDPGTPLQTYEPEVARIDVLLGCNDDSNDPNTGNQYINYSANNLFFDNTLCSSDPAVGIWGGWSASVDWNAMANSYLGDAGTYQWAIPVRIAYNHTTVCFPSTGIDFNPAVNIGPQTYKIEKLLVASEFAQQGSNYTVDVVPNASNTYAIPLGGLTYERIPVVSFNIGATDHDDSWWWIQVTPLLLDENGNQYYSVANKIDLWVNKEQGVSDSASIPVLIP